MRLRTKIILAFWALMIAGCAVTTAIALRQLRSTLVHQIENAGTRMAKNLGRHIAPMLERGDFSAISAVFNAPRSQSEHVAYALLEKDGRVLAASHEAPVSRPNQAFVPPLRQPGDAERVKDTWAHVGDGKLGAVHVGVSLEPVETATNQVVRNVAVAISVAMLLGALFIALLADIFVRPVVELMQIAGRMAQGDFRAKAPARGRDELSALARAFNDMANQIQKRIAESERLRQYFEQILDHLPAGVIVCRATGQIDYANRLVRDGWNMGLPCQGHNSAAANSNQCGRCPAAAVAGARMVPSSILQAAPTGRMFEITHVPLTWDGTNPARILIASDVTEEKVLAQRLHRAERLAVAGEIAAGVVHAVNNPLDGVCRALQLAGRDPGNSKRTSEMLALAQEGVQRIAGITRTLLNLARADESPTMVQVDPNGLVQDALRFVELRAQSRGIRLKAEPAPDVPHVLGEPRALNEVLVNLLLNAIDASTQGGEIIVRTHRGADGTAELAVTDQGGGIAPQHLESIFEPFFSTKPTGQGTGLGLSVARRIIEAHGGEISVESKLGVSSTFRVKLPVGASRHNTEEGVRSHAGARSDC